MAGLDEEVIITHKRSIEVIEETKHKYELISSHTCRRSFCTNQFYKGMPTLLIRKISGHKTEAALVDMFWYLLSISPSDLP